MNDVVPLKYQAIFELVWTYDNLEKSAYLDLRLSN